MDGQSQFSADLLSLGADTMTFFNGWPVPEMHITHLTAHQISQKIMSIRALMEDAEQQQHL